MISPSSSFSIPILPYRPGANSLSVTFKTHLNYVKCIVRLTDGIVININLNPTSQLNSSVLRKFDSLARITTNSIQGEKDACDREKAYAQVASPWIPVKRYYYLYYLEANFLYLLNGSMAGFNRGGHSKVKQEFIRLLADGTISLSGVHARDLGAVVTWQAANYYSTRAGSNITENYHNTSACTESLRKKLAEYIEIDWKQNGRIKNYRTLNARSKRTTELFPKEFCLLEYFYWMRIKANYRDVDFLDFDNNVNEDGAYEYLAYYIRASDQYATALNNAISILKTKRGM